MVRRPGESRLRLVGRVWRLVPGPGEGHEATVSKLDDEQIFYLMSRGLGQAEAMSLIVRGFLDPIAKELPLEYAVELNRLIDLEMEGSVG